MNASHIKTLTLFLFATTVMAVAKPEVGTRVTPPSRRDYTPKAISEAGERGGMLLSVNTNFTANYERAMANAIELWNAHRWDEGKAAFHQIWQTQPDSPWAAEAELHEACYLKYNNQYDVAEARFLSVLSKYPDNLEIQNKVLRYLPHLYAQTGRYQTGLDLLEEMSKLPLGWQERQYIENYSRIFARAKGKDDEDRLCGTKALALALAAQNDRGESLRNVSLDSTLQRHAWGKNKAANPEGFSLQELADFAGAQPVTLSLDELQTAAAPGHPVLVYLKTPKAPKCFTFFKEKAHPDAKPLSGHFVVVERVTDSHVDLLDPDLGKTRWSLAYFQYRWSGATLKLPKQTNMHGKAIDRKSAHLLRGGCCGSPPPDPSDECGDGEDECPCNNGPGGGPGGHGSGGGPGGRGPGGGPGGCPMCGPKIGEGSPAYYFGMSSANFELKDIPMWSEPGKGPTMKLKLSYNRVATQRMAENAGANYYAFGDKWSFNYFSYLTETPNSGVDIVLPGGRVQRFDSSYAPVDIWSKNTLTKTNSYFVLEFDGSGNKWYYNTNTGVEQHLEKIEDKYGDALTFQYDSGNGRLTNVVDALNRSFALSYNASGYVTNVADSFGRNARFAYQGSDLVSMTDMGSLTTTIQYDANHWPTNITYPSGESWQVIFQDNSQLPEPYNYPSYAGAPFRIVVTDPLGQTNEYFYHAFVGPLHNFGYMGPVTQRDKMGNNWLFAIKNVGGSDWDGGGDGSAQRTYYDVVNGRAVPYDGSGDQWMHREFDVEGNPIKVALANTPQPTAIGYTYGEGNWVEDVLTTNLYDGRHNLLSSTLLTNDGSTLQFVGTWTNWYDARDNRLGSKNALNQSTTYSYDSFDRLLSVTNTLTQVTRLKYDAKGNLTNLIDALNRTNRWTYDANGRQFESYYSDGLKISKGYDTVGRLSVVTNNGSGLWLRYNYDDLNRLRDVAFPDGTSNHFEYSCCGLDYTRDRLGRYTIYGRDAIGRTTSVTDPENRVTGFGYNGADQITALTTTVGGEARTKKFAYISTNGFSRLSKVTTPMGKLTRYDYTFRGGLEWRQDGNGNVTKFQYDPLQRLTSVTDSNNNVLVSMDYDALGNVTRVVSTNSVYEYKYDALNRATNAVCLLTNLPGFATVKYSIDYAFDPVGNVTNRLITGLAGMSGTIETRYQYDVMNRLTNVMQLTNNATTASAWYQYDAAGRLYKKGYGNGDVTSHSYDMEGRLLSLGITNGSTPVLSYSYGWDAGGNILAITNNGTNITRYAYDAAGQLTNEICSTNGIAGSTTNSWQYDEAGNWLNADGNSRWVYDRDNELTGRMPTAAATNKTITVTGEVDAGPQSNKWYHTMAECRSVSALVNQTNGTFSLANVPIYPGTNNLLVTVTDVSGNTYQTNRLVVRTNALETFQYDENGNLTNWVNGSTNWVYEWDWANRLTKVKGNGVVVLENYYNSFAQRIAKKEFVDGQIRYMLYLLDGVDIVAVASQNTQVLETFTRGVGLVGDIGTLVAVTHHDGSITNGTFYTHSNHRGDIMLTRNGTTTTGICGYGAFGSYQAHNGMDVCRFKSSCKERDIATGFSYFGYRFYSPAWQRWPNRDPIEEGGGLNLYAYVANDPISYIDPNGFWVWYGNWGGPDWTGGYPGTWEDVVDNGVTPLPPIDGQDECYEAHDKCFASCRDDFRSQGPNKWKSAKMALGKCLRNCDSNLSQCLKNLPSKNCHSRIGSTVFGVLGDIGHIFESDPPPRHSHVN